MRKLSWLALPLLLGASAGVRALPPSGVFLTAQVVGPPRQSMPRELTVRVRPSLALKGQEDLSWETAATCPVRNGQWKCAVPASGRVDLRIEGAAVMPVYRWGEGIGEEQAIDLGTLRLRRGATVSGWLRVDNEKDRPKVPEQPVRVRLVPRGLPGLRVGLRPNPVPLVTLETGSQPWGFFRFDNLPPGLYTVEASAPGFAPVRLGPIRILGDRSIELRRPLRLRRPATLAGGIYPPVPPVRKDQGEAWRVHLLPAPMPSAGVDRVSVAGQNGNWRFTDLAAGNYRLFIQDSRGTTWMSREIHLGPGSRKMDLRIPTRTLVGRVTQAGKPLPVHLNLMGQDLTGPFKTDVAGDGEFQVTVPETPAGQSWLTQIEAPEFLPIVLQDKLRQPRTTAAADRPQIRVPDTLLPVAVVDSRQRPVPFAKVIVPGVPGNYFQTDASGSCEIRGLKAGLQQVLAEHPRTYCRSAVARVALREGSRSPGLCLILPDQIEILGRVEPTFGTAAGALVVARPPGTGPTVSALTDTDGEFRLFLPAGTRVVDLAVLAPGCAFRKLRAEVDPKRLLQVPVDPAGGTLVLEIPEEILKPARAAETLESDLDLLCRWADLQGCRPEPGRLVVPNVEPGPYILSAGDMLKLERGEPAEAGDPRPHGVLEAEGELAMRLPV